MLDKECLFIKGTKGTSFWLIDRKKNLAMPISKYFGCFSPNEGSGFTVTEESDVSLIVTTKKNRITGVYFEKEGKQDPDRKIYLPFEGKMGLVVQIENSYTHYRILFAELQVEGESRSVLFESCGYDKKDTMLPFKYVSKSLQMLNGIEEISPSILDEKEPKVVEEQE